MTAAENEYSLPTHHLATSILPPKMYFWERWCALSPWFFLYSDGTCQPNAKTLCPASIGKNRRHACEPPCEPAPGSKDGQGVTGARSCGVFRGCQGHPCSSWSTLPCFPTSSSPQTSWPQGLRDYAWIRFSLFLFIRETWLPTKACNEHEVARALTMISVNSRWKQSQEALEILPSPILSKWLASLSFYLIFKILGEAALSPLWLPKGPRLRTTEKDFICVIHLDPELYTSVSNSFHPSVISECLSALWVEDFFHCIGRFTSRSA